MTDRHFWHGLVFWEEAFRAWAVREHREVTGAVARGAGPAGDLGDRPVRPGAAWPWDEAEELVIRVPGPVPYQDPVLVADLDGEGLVRVDGEPVWGLNHEHREVPLRLDAGSHPVIALELVRTGLMGRRFMEPRVRRLAWELRDAELEGAAWDLAVLREWGSDADTPSVACAETARLLREALRPVTALPAQEGPWRRWEQRRGGSADEEALYQRLAAGEQIPGLRDLPWPQLEPAVRATARRLREVLAHLSRQYPKGPGRLLALGHAHIDLAWLWPMAETRRKVVRTLASQLALLERYPEWTYGMSSPEMWLGTAEREPGLFGRAVAAASAGRIEPLGAFWVESDCQLLHPASVLRHLLYGLRYFQEALGRRPELAFLPDTFGFGPGLPTLLSAAGIRLFLTTKLYWNDTNRFPYRDFWWAGPDGSRVRGQLFGASAHGYNGQGTLADIRQAWSGYEAGGGEGTVLYTFGYGDGGGGPTIPMLERLRRYRELPSVPDIQWGGATDLVHEEVPELPVHRGPLYLEYHRGVFTAQTAVKRGNLDLERALVALEAWDAWPADADLSLPEAWRRVLRNHFHDILPGSSIAAVYREWEADLAPVHETVALVRRGLLKPDTGEVTGFRVWNASSFPAPARFVEVPADAPFAIDTGSGFEPAQRTWDGHWLVEVPAQGALSQVTYPARPADAPPLSAPVVQETLSIPTKGGDVLIGPEGVRSWRVGERELLSEPAGVRAYWNHPALFDAWEIQPGYEDQDAELVHDRPEILEQGSHRVVVRLRHHVQHSVIEEVLSVTKTDGAIRTRVTETVGDRHLLVRYLVPTSLVASEAEAESVWGMARYPTVPEGPADAARFEWVAHRFVSLAEPHCGVALLNDGRYGHSLVRGTLGVTLSTAPLYPDPEADRGPAPVTLELVAHGGSWRDAGIQARAHALGSTWAAVGGFRPEAERAPLAGLPENVGVLGVRAAADGSGDHLVYLGETWGDQTQAVIRPQWPVEAVLRADLISEESQGATLARPDPASGTLAWGIAPWSLEVLRLASPR